MLSGSTGLQLRWMRIWKINTRKAVIQHVGLDRFEVWGRYMCTCTGGRQGETPLKSHTNPNGAHLCLLTAPHQFTPKPKSISHELDVALCAKTKIIYTKCNIITIIRQIIQIFLLQLIRLIKKTLNVIGESNQYLNIVVTVI